MFHYPFLNAVISDWKQWIDESPAAARMTISIPYLEFQRKGETAIIQEFKEQSLEKWVEHIPTVVDMPLRELIVSAVKKQLIRRGEINVDIVDLEDRVNAYFTRPKYLQFEYTALCIAKSNPLKLSSFRKVRLVPYLLDKVESKLVNDANRKWFAESLRHVGLYKTLINMCSGHINRNSIPDDIRRAKGTYIKPAKFLQLAFDDILSSSEISTVAGHIATSLRRIANKGNTDGVKVSDTPSRIYSMSTDSSVESCMAYDHIPAKRFTIYNDIPCCKIAYMENESGDLIARALLWEEVKNEDTGEVFKMMDRIYSADMECLTIMQNWASEHGYWYKEEQALFVFDFVLPDGSTRRDWTNLSIPAIKFKAGQYDEVPYIDTFAFCDKGTSDRLYSTINGWLPDEDGDEEEHGFIRMQNTGGKARWICKGSYKCAECGDYIPSGEARHLHDLQYCEHCFKKVTEICQCCDCIELKEYMQEVPYGPDEDMERIRICDDCYELGQENPNRFEDIMRRNRDRISLTFRR